MYINASEYGHVQTGGEGVKREIEREHELINQSLTPIMAIERGHV
jgi:hypothetical protein